MEKQKIITLRVNRMVMNNVAITQLMDADDMTIEKTE